MILIVSVCADRLHGYEFVKPIEDILKRGGIEFESFHYKQLNDKILARVDKVIICGTSLKDSEYLKDIDKFDWVRDFDKPLLGICAGFQIIGLVNNGRLKKKLEIGYFHEKFNRDFLGLRGDVEVYHLHNNYIEFSESTADVPSEEGNFGVFNSGKIAQAVKHKNKEIYGVLFHPEVRQKEMILEFVDG